MKSPFTEYVVALHRDKFSPEAIFEAAKERFKGSTICFYQVERAIENFRRGLITETGEYKHADPQ